jgi:starch phosphorylase
VTRVLPARLSKLEDLAYDLQWSWDPQARLLFKRLDPELWRQTRHNPVRLLNQISPLRLNASGLDDDFVRAYDAIVERHERKRQSSSWFSSEFPRLSGATIAYFSAEFGLHSSLPIYSGGLGILSGDHCKESADLGIPLVGVGFMYLHGYFHQRLRADGWQEEIYEELDRANAPLKPASPDKDRFLLELQIGAMDLFVEVWRVRLGGMYLYLMDTEIPENTPADRALTARLYGGDREHRIRQEIVLGIGGVRVLRALGIAPLAFHANEGHTSFMMVERVRELVVSGLKVADAAQQVRGTSVFTTHTPVAAGHDAFPLDMVDRHLAGYWDDMGLTRQQFMDLGSHEGLFNMTVLALRLADYRNGVSALHGRVTRRMWKSIWPEKKEETIPITSVTNGVHAPSWIAPELGELLARHLGADWMERHDDPALLNRVIEIPDDEFWNVHLLLKHKFLTFVRERDRSRWAADRIDPRQTIAMGALLDPDALTIGFARRFTGYKRASLIFSDRERIKRILLDADRPVQIVFAGKAHPADDHGKHLIHEIYSLAADNGLAGHVAFVENYEIHTAHFFTQGVDAWLNNPLAPLEACGTSGQKAGMNGVLNISVPDGWWYEGHNGKNGWAIGQAPENLEVQKSDTADAEALYRLLEDRIVPLYYERGEQDIPHGWIRMAKESLRSVIPQFSARRMLKEYATRMYVPACLEALKTKVRKP